MPAELQITAGETQNGIVGQPLGSPLQVEVLDAEGNPVAGVAVVFALQPLSGTLSDDTVASDEQGKAASVWTLPAIIGNYTAKAWVSGVDTVAFGAVAAPGGPGQIRLISSDSQSALVGELVIRPVAVQLDDVYGNPVASTTVTFAVVTGAGNLSETTVVTDGGGTASTTWTWGTAAGIQSIEISVEALPPLQVTGLRFPVLPPERLSVSGQHGCWLITSGAGFCWGGNESGQLGDGSLTTRHAPVPVSGGLMFRSIATGGLFTGHSSPASTCGVSVDSVAYCWGSGFPVSSSTPLPLANAPTIVSVTMGIGFGCGLASEGIAYCWGTNTKGQLGDGTTTAHDIPAPVAGDLRFRQVSAGGQHVCGVTLTGGLFCWGDNLNAQIGNGVQGSNSNLTPIPIGGTVRFSSVRASTVHSCAQSLDGGFWCWGNDGRGQVTAGDGNSLFVMEPTPVSSGLTFGEFGLGYEHTCGLVSDGTAYCWGRNYEFALGDSVFGERATPAPVLGGHHFSLIDADLLSTCGISTAEELFCWGRNLSGLVGVPDSTVQLAPVPVLGGFSFASISTGLWHSCGLTAAGAAFCWGNNMSWGELGDGTNNPRSAPEPVTGGHTFTSVDAGGFSTCGVDAGGAGYCWGKGEGGEIGDGVLTSRNTPAPVAGNHSFSAISVGFGQACGLTTGGEAWCWGYADVGGTPLGLPVLVTSPEALTQVSAGWRKSCALGSSGSAFCWTPGSGSLSPTAEMVGGPSFSQIQTGLYYACGLTSGGTAYCWGMNQFGQLGDGSSTETNIPVAVTGGLTFASIGVSSDGSTTCGVTMTGAAHCWGRNDFGEAGIGTLGGVILTPTPVSGGLTLTQISPSAFHSCALNTQGAGWCWGTGQYGELGNGATLAVPLPRKIQ